MQKIAGVIRQVSLGHLLIFLSILALLIALTLVGIFSGVVRDRAVHDLAREDAKQTSQMVFQSLYSAMRKGWDKDEIAQIVDRLNHAMPGMEIKVYRGAVVEKQFGEMPGEHQAIASDSVLQQALKQGGDELVVLPDQQKIRYLYPVHAKQECLVCHTQSYLGAIHGVIDITYPVDKLKISFSYVLNSVLGYTLLMMAMVFTVLYFKLRYLVVTPIARLVDVMQRITHGMDFSHRVSDRFHIMELQHLSEYFNRLLNTVQEYNHQLEELSTRDPLTGLYNRRKFEEFLDFEQSRAERHAGYHFSIIMIDVDDFKFVNDSYGHPVGDMALKKMSMLLEACLRKGDLLARLGGDEFAVILPGADPAQAMLVARKLHATLSSESLELPVGNITLSASFSVVSYPEDGKTKTELQTAMDVVLYKAKSRGKNQVQTAESDQDRSMMHILRQGDYLKRALQEDRIQSFLQPIVRVNTEEVAAYEALARIVDGDKLISAGQFIEVAEELGMIHELDVRMFNKGLQQLQYLAYAQPNAKMFFNLSARTFGNAEWMRSIPAQLAAHNIRCDRLVLEITEREALPHLNEVKAIIDELRHHGIAFALDDFGSGFSSFLYLKYLTVDYVKIEGSFVRQIAIDDRDLIMVKHIHQVAKDFGLKTVAEFVEDSETAEILNQLGVDLAQGYYYGHPKASA